MSNYFDFVARRRYPISASTAAIRRQVYRERGGFKEGLSVGADIEFWARLALVTKIAYDPNETAVYNWGLPGSALSVATWDSRVPAVVETLIAAIEEGQVRESDRRGAKQYATTVVLNHVAQGILKGERVNDLLSYALKHYGCFRLRWIKLWAASAMPNSLIRCFLLYKSRVLGVSK
jgi:hypothetical protein